MAISSCSLQFIIDLHNNQKISSKESKQMNQDLMKDLQDLEDSEENQMDEEKNNLSENDSNVQDDQQIFKANNNQNLSQLIKDKQFLELIATVERLINTKIQAKDIKASFAKDKKEETSIIHRCNHYAAEIDREIRYIVKFVKKGYNNRLPELESIVTKPSLYCKALLEIEEGDIIDYLTENKQRANAQTRPFKYLSAHQSISLRLAASSPHESLVEPEQSQILAAARTVTLLYQHHNLLMIYLESCMQIVAPNLCKLVGSAISSKLISGAGGIDKLAFMPACNIQVMGGNRSANIGLSMMERNHTGIFGEMEIVKNAPKKFMMQLVRMLACNTAKCARADFLGTTSGIQGDKLRDQMIERFEKVQEEGGLLRIEQPLPIPDEAPKKKRGGKRFRKMKELYQMSEIAKHKNRVKFGEEAQAEVEGGQGLGMLKQGIGKLNVKIKKQNLNLSKRMQQRINIQKKQGMGMESTINLASNQGIELVNPTAVKEMNERKGTESIFDRSAGFRTILNQKLAK